MEQEPTVVAPSLAISSKLAENQTNAFPYHSYPQPSLAPFTAYQQSPYSSNIHFQSPNDLFDTKTIATMNSQRPLDGSVLQSLQSRMMESSKLANVNSQDKISLSSSSSGPVAINGPATPSAIANFPYDERFHALYEREIRWNEVRRYIELIRRVSSDSHMELTKDAFYDLYNLALLLLKSVDSLDPDKNKKPEPPQYYAPPHMSGAMTSASMIASQMVQGQELSDMLAQQRAGKGSGYMMDIYGRTTGLSNGPAYTNGNAFDGTTYLSSVPKYAPLPTDQNIYASPYAPPEGMIAGAPYPMQVGVFGQPQTSYLKTPTTSGTATPITSIEPKNFTGEVFFDDVGQGTDGNRPKRRRRRTVYSSRRNLHCHMCGVTETPEWRRGPAGDHTLCNACGLHYAKSLKKQRKERDTRKLSIDMLLNENQQPALTSQTNHSSTMMINSPLTNGTHSPDSSQEDLTPPTDLL